jgi:hypothetical protein
VGACFGNEARYLATLATHYPATMRQVQVTLAASVRLPEFIETLKLNFPDSRR